MNWILLAPRLPRLVWVTALALLMALFASVAPASAAVPGLQRIASPLTTGSSSTQTAIATCPPGTKVIGAGGTISGPVGRVILRRVIPSASLASVTAAGAETGAGTTSDWSVQAFAVCANATAVPGLQLFQTDSDFNSDASKAANINCPTGTQLLGVGGALFGQGASRVVLQGITPNGAGTGAVTVGAETSDGTSESWNVRTYAICANPLPGYQQVVRISGPDSTATRSITALAPSGTKLLGGGATVNGQHGRLGLTGIVPAADLSQVVATGTEVGAGLSTNWSMNAYAIGATP